MVTRVVGLSYTAIGIGAYYGRNLKNLHDNYANIIEKNTCSWFHRLCQFRDSGGRDIDKSTVDRQTNQIVGGEGADKPDSWSHPQRFCFTKFGAQELTCLKPPP